MATQSILRHGIVSPTLVTKQRTASARSILKRPGALPLSPAHPFTVSFSIQQSPLRSPQPALADFEDPRSPTRVTLQRAASARSILKRPGALPLSPTYPFTACFSIQHSPLVRSPLVPPRPVRSISTAHNSPAITDFEDPRSPKAQPPAKENLLRFEALASNQTAARLGQPLASALVSYPRSPYPSAPLVSAEHVNYQGAEDSPTQRARASSLELPKRNKKGLTLGPSVTSVAPTPSSLGRSVFSPSINEDKVPAPLDLESRLNEAFWNSVSLAKSDEDDEAMFTALEYPSSAVDPQIMYASADGALWSPALPKPGVAVNKIRESLMSPGKSSSISGVFRKDITAPTPNDPFAAFPSFTAAMEGTITYPSRVVLG